MLNAGRLNTQTLNMKVFYVPKVDLQIISVLWKNNTMEIVMLVDLFQLRSEM